MKNGALLLPTKLLNKASLRGKEYAWPVDIIPEVIEAGRAANLLNIGGQLQFRLPGGGTCECYWIAVDTYKSVSSKLPWEERVDLAANASLKDFEALRSTKDFIKEGEKDFANLAKDVNLSESMCFVWYLSTEEDELNSSSK